MGGVLFSYCYFVARVILGGYLGWMGRGPVLYEYGDISDARRRAKDLTSCLMSRGILAGLPPYVIKDGNPGQNDSWTKQYNELELHDSLKVEQLTVSSSKHLIVDSDTHNITRWRQCLGRCILQPSYRFAAREEHLFHHTTKWPKRQ